MIVYPAIDIQGGRAVRLLQGRAADTTDYGNPQEMALRWHRAGAEWIHVVDLDGAFSGTGANAQALADIVRATPCKVQTGGGIRSMEDIALRLDEIGVARVILGTVAVEKPEIVKEACQKWPGKIAVGIDARDGKIATRGWVQLSNLDAIELALEMKDFGVLTIIYTDISRDGMLGGVNVAATARMAQVTGMEIIGSGGVASVEDIISLRQAGAAGVITGKALYEGKFTLKEALLSAKS